MVRTYNDSESEHRGTMQPIRKREKLADRKSKLKNAQKEIAYWMDMADKYHKEIQELEK